MTEFLDTQALGGRWFDGEWRKGSASWPAVEPATGQEFAQIGGLGPNEVSAVAAAAREAQVAWAAAAPDDRAGVLRKAAENARQNFQSIVDMIVRESGSVPAKAEFELSLTIKALDIAAGAPYAAQGQVLPSEAGRISLARRKPLGVVGVIAPFNFPLYLAMRAVAPALAMGNAVILKPDPRTTICGGWVIARIFEDTDLPHGVLSLTPGGGDVGAALCADRNVAMIQFTGSTEAGRKVGELASKHLKKVSLELGGKNSLIILEDADLDLAAKNAAWAAYLHQGQICMTAGRIFVHSSILADFADKLREKARNLPVGDPATQQVALGPMINQGQCDRVVDIVQRSVDGGAELVEGGTADGLMFKPAVLSGVKPGSPAYEEEIFGPVAVLVPFDSDDDVVAMANNTEYGLSAAIISPDVARAMALGDRLHTGILHINDQTVNDEVVNPFGGVGDSGNGTSIGGPANWEEFTHWQWTTIKSAPPPYPF